MNFLAANRSSNRAITYVNNLYCAAFTALLHDYLIILDKPSNYKLIAAEGMQQSQ
jgi:hypothetical protein